MISLQGNLLAAAAHIVDPFFMKSVVLLLHHDGEGAQGVVLNRPLDPPEVLEGNDTNGDDLSPSLFLDVVSSLVGNSGGEPFSGPLPAPVQAPVYLGGPAPSAMIAVHKVQAIGEIETQPGVFVAENPQHVNGLLQQDRYPYRLFVGHAAWGADQLDEEVQRGHWLVTPAADRFIFADYKHLWLRVVRQVGWSVLESSLKIKHLPPSPCSN